VSASAKIMVFVLEFGNPYSNIDLYVDFSRDYVSLNKSDNFDSVSWNYFVFIHCQKNRDNFYFV